MNRIKQMMEKLDPETKKFVLEQKDFELQEAEISDGLQRYLDLINPAFGHRTETNCLVTDALFCAISTLISDADKVLEQLETRPRR